MKTFWWYLLILYSYQDASCLIIPDELPSILSLIYSNIPTLKKGTDSRLGWGFRLGDRADFQVLVELGPQKNTQTLANQGENANNKRELINTLINDLYAQRQHEKKIIADTDGGKFLQQWSRLMTTQPPNKINFDRAAPSRHQLGIGEVDAKSVIPPDSILKLREMYYKQLTISVDSSTEESSKSTTIVPLKTTTDALDNVSLDD